MKYDKNHQAFLIPILSLAIAIGLLPYLPPKIPMQFQMNGEVTWAVSKYIAIWILPVIECVLILYKRHEPIKSKLYVYVIALSILQFIVLFIAM